VSDARNHWNERYATSDRPKVDVASFLAAMTEYLPATGTALDLGGGTGRNALWLAGRGLDVTLADLSDVALAQGAEAARELGLELEYLQRDLEADGLPDGRTWDLAIMHLFYPRELLRQLPAHLAAGGVLLFCQPTTQNLDRHQRPPARFLVEPGELETVAKSMDGVEILELSEGWRHSDRHDAWLAVRRL